MPCITPERWAELHKTRSAEWFADIEKARVPACGRHCFDIKSEAWRAFRQKHGDAVKPRRVEPPARPTQTHAKASDGFRLGVGDALAWAFGVMGYKVNAGCSCKSTQRWANERRWHEWTRASVRRELLKRLSDEARRRKILPRCRCKGGACSRDSWGRLIRAGIRDRARATWLAIQQAGRGHAHGAGHHRGPDPRA